MLVAAAELEVLEHKRVPDELETIVNKVGDAMLGWRYASRVADGALMRAKPSMTVDLVDGFVTRFGNDPYIWAYARRVELACGHDGTGRSARRGDES